MITKLEIKDFRNIKSISYDLKLKTLFAGKNGLGKSNTLNALMWILTDSLLTDNYGVGESDIDTIVPDNFQKGIVPEVSITIGDTKFTKKYRTKFQKGTDSINGHTTEYYINDVPCDKAKDFTQALYGKLDFTPKFENVSVNELKLFTDPLYALQKLDAKSLRALLVAIGCSVSNEEMYRLGFEDLRTYENQYLGKFDVMRKDTNKKRLATLKEIELTESQLVPFMNVEQYNDEYAKQIEVEMDKLKADKAAVLSGNNKSEIEDLQNQIKAIENDKAFALKQLRQDYQLTKDKIEAERNNKLAQFQESKNDHLKPFKEKVDKLTNLINQEDLNAKRIKSTIDNSVLTLTNTATLGRNSVNRRSLLSTRLTVVENKQYSNFIICPHCGEKIVPNQEDLDNFEASKQADIKSIKEEMEALSNTIENSKKVMFDNEQVKVANEKQLEAVMNELSTNQIELNNAIQELEDEDKKYSERSIQKEYLDRIDAIKYDEDTTSYDNKILIVKAKIEDLLNQNQQIQASKLIQIDNKLSELNESLKAEYAKESQYKTKLEIKEKIAMLRKSLNDIEFLLGRLNDFIHKMISLINEKALEKTGIKFVMMEENLTNDNVTEVCYATVNGVPFASVNTSEKLRVGISFIETLKRIAKEDFGAGINTLPILADKMEAFDSLDTIITKDQFIGTKVSNEEIITIL